MNLNFLLNKPYQKPGPRDKYDESTNSPSAAYFTLIFYYGQ